jgi:dTDP-4-dehydrorhamnose reductase
MVLHHFALLLQIWQAWAVAWDTDTAEDSEHQQAVYTLASAALPDCVMFAFALADVLQAHKQEAAALQVYEVRTVSQACSYIPGLSNRHADIDLTLKLLKFRSRIAAQ